MSGVSDNTHPKKCMDFPPKPQIISRISRKFWSPIWPLAVPIPQQVFFWLRVSNTSVSSNSGFRCPVNLETKSTMGKCWSTWIWLNFISWKCHPAGKTIAKRKKVSTRSKGHQFLPASFCTEEIQARGPWKAIGSTTSFLRSCEESDTIGGVAQWEWALQKTNLYIHLYIHVNELSCQLVDSLTNFGAQNIFGTSIYLGQLTPTPTNPGLQRCCRRRSCHPMWQVFHHFVWQQKQSE